MILSHFIIIEFIILTNQSIYYLIIIFNLIIITLYSTILIDHYLFSLFIISLYILHYYPAQFIRLILSIKVLLFIFIPKWIHYFYYLIIILNTLFCLNKSFFRLIYSIKDVYYLTALPNFHLQLPHISILIISTPIYINLPTTLIAN